MKKHLSRRDFLRSSAAAAAPMIVPASVFGRQGRPAAGEKLAVGMIGVGKMGMFHVDRFTVNLKNDTRILAVCDVDAARREHAKKLVDERTGKGTVTYVDYRELLARKDIDAVCVATPDHWHATVAIEAMKAGKDVYCEKPLTLTIHEAKLLIEAARKYGRVFQTGSQQRSDGPFRNVCDVLRNGRLGKVKEVHVGIGPTSKWCDLPAQEPDPGLDWDRWLGPCPKRAYHEVLCRKGLPDKYPFNPGWRDYREYSGGYVTDWGAHHFDITQWALGMDEAGPVEIIPPEKENDVFGTRLVYRNTALGDEVVVVHKQMKNGITFVGEKGEIFVNRSDKDTKSTPETILKEPLEADAKRLFKSPGHHRNWLDCVKSRQKPICDVEIGARSVTVCHLVNLAIWNRRKLAWDPKEWKFVGDDEANKWLDRERREAYPLPQI